MKRALVPAAAVAIAVLALPRTVHGHGSVAEPASLLDVILAWSVEAHVIVPLAVAWLAYAWAVRRVAREHPANPAPRWRAWSWYGGLGALFVALQSPIATYDTVFFSAHMIQHLLITLVAAPLLAIGAPITLLLRVTSPRIRRRFVLPVLHSPPVRLISFPVVAWVLFAAVMWASHFSPLYDRALESEALHVLEHGLYLASGLLFWWPVVGADPSPWRMPHPARIGYLFLGMPQSSFLGLVIFSAPQVLYEHYATLERDWGPSALADQQLAGGIMWVGGDILFLIPLFFAVWAWMRYEEQKGARDDARLDAERARAAR